MVRKLRISRILISKTWQLCKKFEYPASFLQLYLYDIMTIMTFYDILQQITTFYDILRQITAFYNILRHFTTF